MAVLKSEGAGGPKSKEGKTDQQLSKDLSVDVSPELPGHGILGMKGALEVMKSKFGTMKRKNSNGTDLNGNGNHASGATNGNGHE
jgi:hypothetical protein